jgi:hypothetical protein
VNCVVGANIQGVLEIILMQAQDAMEGVLAKVIMFISFKINYILKYVYRLCKCNCNSYSYIKSNNEYAICYVAILD